MRRLTLITGMLLTLTAGVWGSALVAASASCMHEANATEASGAPGEHDCCRAKVGDSDAHHSQSHDVSQAASHDASHDISQDAPHETSTAREQAGDSHAGMNCGGADASQERESVAASIGERGLSSSCGECCAGGTGQTPATAIVAAAPEQNKVKRAAGSVDSASARELFAHATLHAARLAHTRHAPHAPPERRHMLIGVFLI